MKNPTQKKKRQRHPAEFILTAVTAVLIFTSAVVLNFLTPLFADDFSYSVSFETKLLFPPFMIYTARRLSTTNQRTDDPLSMRWHSFFSGLANLCSIILTGQPFFRFVS